MSTTTGTSSYGSGAGASASTKTAGALAPASSSSMSSAAPFVERSVRPGRTSVTAGSAVLELVLPAHADPPVGRVFVPRSRSILRGTGNCCGLRRPITGGRHLREDAHGVHTRLAGMPPGGYLERVIVWL